MKVNCISCGNDITLDHMIFHDYDGSIKCFCCGAMMEVKVTGGFLYSINPLGILKSPNTDNLREVRT